MVVEPVEPSYVVKAIDPGIDHPSRPGEQIAWIEAAGMLPRDHIGLTEISS